MLKGMLSYAAGTRDNLREHTHYLSYALMYGCELEILAESVKTGSDLMPWIITDAAIRAGTMLYNRQRFMHDLQGEVYDILLAPGILGCIKKAREMVRDSSSLTFEHTNSENPLEPEGLVQRIYKLLS